MNSADDLLRNVVDPGYCMGCGACTVLHGSPFRIVDDNRGNFVAALSGNPTPGGNDYGAVCPFAAETNETQIADAIFAEDGRKWDDSIGFYRKLFAGYVARTTFRENGSSGGFATWILATLLRDGIVDAVIHVKPADSSQSTLFEYSVSETESAVIAGAKTRYYPVTLEDALAFVRANDRRYALVGVPCFIKAVRLLQRQDPVFESRIRFTVGLVCGHMKSRYFSEALAWEMGIEPGTLQSIDFRAKTPSKPASFYKIRATGRVGEGVVETETFASGLLSYNWGLGLFRNNACNYCDDVMNETADISIGDAWIPPYESDPGGNNIVIIRSVAAEELIERHTEELVLSSLAESDLVESQGGGLRDRREGLAYRLHLEDYSELTSRRK